MSYLHRNSDGEVFESYGIRPRSSMAPSDSVTGEGRRGSAGSAPVSNAASGWTRLAVFRPALAGDDVPPPGVGLDQLLRDQAAIWKLPSAMIASRFSQLLRHGRRRSFVAKTRKARLKRRLLLMLHGVVHMAVAPAFVLRWLAQRALKAPWGRSR